jgi:hypothetical protein
MSYNSMINLLPDLINAWLQPGAQNNGKYEPFQRLFFPAKTVKTVFLFSCESTGLKPGLNENSSCAFAHVGISYSCVL